MGGGTSNILHDFMIIIEQGKAAPVEAILNSLAAKVGLQGVNVTI
jgi:hypothetical protein